MRLLQLKPRRTASGVATISVLTKPWPCGGACLYCPNDVRMPKSYIWDEPACQRAEHSFFDPYLQVAVRLHVLAEMGHPTDKVELIVLGGTWDDYPRGYRIWFVEQLFRALNDGDASWGRVRGIRDAYHGAGLADEPGELRARTAATQTRIDAGDLTYNQAIAELYRDDPVGSAYRQDKPAPSAACANSTVSTNALPTASWASWWRRVRTRSRPRA